MTPGRSGTAWQDFQSDSGPSRKTAPQRAAAADGHFARDPVASHPAKARGQAGMYVFAAWPGFRRHREGVDRIAELTAEIVQVTRLEGDPRMLKLERVDLHKLIVDVARDCCSESQAEWSRIAIEGKAWLRVTRDGLLMQRAIESCSAMLSDSVQRRRPFK